MQNKAYKKNKGEKLKYETEQENIVGSILYWYSGRIYERPLFLQL